MVSPDTYFNSLKAYQEYLHNIKSSVYLRYIGTETTKWYSIFKSNEMTYGDCILLLNEIEYKLDEEYNLIKPKPSLSFKQYTRLNIINDIIS